MSNWLPSNSPQGAGSRVSPSGTSLRALVAKSGWSEKLRASRSSSLRAAARSPFCSMQTTSWYCACAASTLISRGRCGHLAENLDGRIHVPHGFLGVNAFLKHVRGRLVIGRRANQEHHHHCRDEMLVGHDLKLQAQCYRIVTPVSFSGAVGQTIVFCRLSTSRTSAKHYRQRK